MLDTASLYAYVQVSIYRILYNNLLKNRYLQTFFLLRICIAKCDFFSQGWSRLKKKEINFLAFYLCLKKYYININLHHKISKVTVTHTNMCFYCYQQVYNMHTLMLISTQCTFCFFSYWEKADTSFVIKAKVHIEK